MSDNCLQWKWADGLSFWSMGKGEPAAVAKDLEQAYSGHRGDAVRVRMYKDSRGWEFENALQAATWIRLRWLQGCGADPSPEHTTEDGYLRMYGREIPSEGTPDVPPRGECSFWRAGAHRQGVAPAPRKCYAEIRRQQIFLHASADRRQDSPDASTPSIHVPGAKIEAGRSVSQRWEQDNLEVDDGEERLRRCSGKFNIQIGSDIKWHEQIDLTVDVDGQLRMVGVGQDVPGALSLQNCTVHDSETGTRVYIDLSSRDQTERHYNECTKTYAAVPTMIVIDAGTPERRAEWISALSLLGSYNLRVTDSSKPGDSPPWFLAFGNKSLRDEFAKALKNIAQGCAWNTPDPEEVEMESSGASDQPSSRCIMDVETAKSEALDKFRLCVSVGSRQWIREMSVGATVENLSAIWDTIQREEAPPYVGALATAWRVWRIMSTMPDPKRMTENEKTGEPRKTIERLLSNMLAHVFDERRFSGPQLANSRSAIFELLDVPLNEWFQLEASDDTVTAWAVATTTEYAEPRLHLLREVVKLSSVADGAGQFVHAPEHQSEPGEPEETSSIPSRGFRLPSILMHARSNDIVETVGWTVVGRVEQNSHSVTNVCMCIANHQRDDQALALLLYETERTAKCSAEVPLENIEVDGLTIKIKSTEAIRESSVCNLLPPLRWADCVLFTYDRSGSTPQRIHSAECLRKQLDWTVLITSLQQKQLVDIFPRLPGCLCWPESLRSTLTACIFGRIAMDGTHGTENDLKRLFLTLLMDDRAAPLTELLFAAFQNL